MKKLFLFSFILFFSCNEQEESDPPSNNQNVKELKGTKWQLFGFYESDKVTFEPAKPEDCTECFLLEFRDSNFIGYSTANEFSGNYSSSEDSENDLQLTNFLGTEINERSEDGARYGQALNYVHSFQLSENQLKLFYGDQGNFLLFDKIP